MKLSLGPNNQIGVLTFYSKHADFFIQEGVIGDIKTLVEMKYLETLELGVQGLEKATNTLLKTGYNDVQKYLDNLTRCICEDFQFECASVFVKENGHQHLALRSSFNHNGHVNLEEEITYSAGEDSLTNYVWEEPEYMHLMYDLTEENSGAKKFIGETENKPTNWFGFAVVDDDEVIAVIHGKNKFSITKEHKKVIVSPSPSDNSNLRALRSLVTSQLVNARRMERLNKKLILHDNLSKVYRHEIRGPLSSIVTIPQHLINMLDEAKKDKTIAKVVKGLEDLKDLASNLAFIAKTHDIDNLIKNHSARGEHLQLMQDLIFPIYKLTKNYFLEKYDSEVILDHESLRNIRIYGKKELYSMVLYALLDNAGKYQVQEEGPIRVYGKLRDDGAFIDLFIENNGLRISREESELIFGDNTRGIEATSSRIDGSGIGLWMCKKITQSFQGDIVLVNNYDPVRFKVSLPLRKL